MASQKPTPEEKLFAVIQGAPSASPRARAQALSLVSLRAQLAATVKTVDLPRANQALAVVMALLGGFCLVNPWLMRPRLDQLLSRATQQVVPFAIATPLEGMQEADAYVALARAQDPFRIGEAPPTTPTVMGDLPEPPEIPPMPQGPTAQELLADFRLVGIAWGAEPRVMIEQVSAQTTHILKPGDAIGDFTVKDIFEDRAVLQIGDQEVDLF